MFKRLLIALGLKKPRVAKDAEFDAWADDLTMPKPRQRLLTDPSRYMRSTSPESAAPAPVFMTPSWMPDTTSSDDHRRSTDSASLISGGGDFGGGGASGSWDTSSSSGYDSGSSSYDSGSSCDSGSSSCGGD